MRKKLVGLIVVFLIVAAGVVGAYQYLGAADDVEEGIVLDRNKVVIKTISGITHEFTVEVADDPESMSRGLMFRSELAPEAGMIFLFPQKQMTAFWMKNTLIPLDMLFIDTDGTIKYIHENAEPGSLEQIWSRYPVQAVLEINGGASSTLGIAAGDTAIHPFFNNGSKLTEK